MKRLLSFVFVGLSLFAVASCSLGSNKPLLKAADGDRSFGERLVAVREVAGGSYLDTNGKPSAFVGEAEGGAYRLAGSKDGKAVTLSFHRADDLPFDYIVQMEQADLTLYFPARRTEDGLAVAMVSFSKKLSDALKKRGVFGKGGAIDIDSLDKLREAFRVWAALPESESLYTYRYRIAVGDAAQETLMRSVMTEFCLSRAGHPSDPAVSRLPQKYAAGVLMDAIDVAAAKQACDWAREPGAPPSARYALARVLLRAEDYAAERKLIDELLAEDFN